MPGNFAIGVVISDAHLWQEVLSALEALPVRIVFEQAGIPDLSGFLDKLERTNPDAVLIDLASAKGDLAALVPVIEEAPSAPLVVVVHDEGKSEDILEALRAGAKEFLVPPLKAALEAALPRLQAERKRNEPKAAPRNKGRSLGFLAAKGGCGATTVACHAAVALERMTSKPTLLCDLDLSAGLVRFLMRPSTRYSVTDALANVQRIDHSYWHALVSNGHGHLDILPGPEMAPVKELPSLSQIRQMLTFARSEYAWVVADLGRGLSPATMAAIEELDELYLVTTPDVPALHQAKQMIAQLFGRGVGRNTLRLLLNRIPRRLEVSPQELELLLGQPFYSRLLDHEDELREAYTEGHLLGPDSALTHEIEELVGKLADLPPRPRRRFAVFG